MYPVCHWNPFAPGQPLFGMGSPYIPDGHNATEQTMENEDNGIAYLKPKIASRFLFHLSRTYINSWKPLRIYFHRLEGNCGKLLQRIFEVFFFFFLRRYEELWTLCSTVEKLDECENDALYDKHVALFMIQLRAFRLSAVRRSHSCETKIE